MPRDEVFTEPERFDLDWFQTHRPLTIDFKMHNAALKFFRHQGEEAGLIVVPFDNMRGNLMKPVIHGETTDFDFDFEAADIQWRWQDMVAMLTSESMRYVVEGELRGDSSAVAAACLTGCSLCQSGIIDHKRAHADKKKYREPIKRFVWDFVINRDDGTQVILHPSWSSERIEVKYGDPNRRDNQVVDEELPLSGLGGSSGPGTFKYFKEKHNMNKLSFRRVKAPPTAKAKAY